MPAQSNLFFWRNNIISFSIDTSKYETSIYGTQNGLPSSEITALAQDKQGYLWVGTSVGLSRYDGVKFENFLRGDNFLTGKVYAIKEDTVRNVLWIASDGGLYYIGNQKLHRVNFTNNDITFYDIYLADDKTMWAGTGRGPAFFSERTIDRELNGNHISIDSFLLPQWKIVNSISAPAYKIIGTSKSSIYIAGAGGIFFYHKKILEKIWSSIHQQNNNDYIVGLAAGNDSAVYFASVFSGLFKISNREITTISDSNLVASDLIEHKGDIYYYTMGGIFKLSRDDRELKKISEVPLELNIWPSCLLVDNESNLWIGMHDNLLYQKPRIFSTWKNKVRSAEAELYSIVRLKNNQLLFGANRGKVYKKEGDKFENIFGDKGAVPNAEIKAIYEDSRRWLWFGTGYQGVVVIINNQIKNFTIANGLSNNSNYFFYEDADKNIYTGGDGGFSKITYDSSLKSFRFKNFYYKVAGENIETFKGCIAGPDNTLWLAGQMGIFHLTQDSLIHFSINAGINLNITDIKKDSSGNVWLATKGNGIWQCCFDAANKIILKKNFTEEEGLQSDIYLSITVDHENNIWAGSYSGITSIKNKNGIFSITNFAATDGFFSSNYRSLKLYCDVGDTIWVAASAGLTSFVASGTSANKKLLLNFTNILLADSLNKVSAYKGTEENSITELPYYLNEIEFRFKAICLSDPQKIKYTYRLKGFGDTAWVDWNDKEVAFYQSLSPGSYVFEVKASLDNNIISGLVTFPFIIKKPFWLSWWFIILSAFLLICIIYITAKKWKKNVDKKNEEKIKTQQLISDNLQYQLEVEQVTNYFATSISTSSTVDDLLWNVARQCISKLNFEDCVIYIIDEKNNMLIQKAAWGPKSYQHSEKESSDNKILSPIEIPVGKGIVGTVALTGIAEIIPDVTKDSRYIKDDMQRSSEISVPVIYDNHILGVIDSESQYKNFYSQRHLQILTAIASHCAERIVKLKAEEDLHRNEAELLQTKNRLAEEKLTALRSQMNPHFIFNCLNSIQQYILKGEVDNANKYLSRFSKLIRLVLQYSEYNFISLEDEINMLQLYLSLEKIRFGNSFEYNINVEEELDAEEIKIPNLMIQPFVENAIWHGLMHKEGDRKIEIKFSLINEQSLVCEITDNGIGRKRASEIKEFKSLEIKHQSKGMQLVKDKIDVLKQQFKSEIFIELSDVINNNGEICGTKVLLQLPLQYQ